MKTLVSIIIPVYNTKEYLSECFDSILNQTFRGIEIVIIDDGSNDGSEKIIDEYARKYNNIKAVHQANSGVSVARNNGIANASADWIMFVDSDDWLELDAIEEAYSRISDDVDIVAQAFFYNEKNKVYPMKSNAERLFSLKENKSELLAKTRINTTVFFHDKLNCDLRLTSQCAKLYRKSVIDINNVCFPVGVKANEDGFFNLNFLIYARNILFYNHQIYHCHQRPDSASRNLVGKADVIITSIEYFDKYISEFGLNDELIKYKYIDTIIKTSLIFTILAQLYTTKQMKYTDCVSECKKYLKHKIIQNAIRKTKIEDFKGTRYKNVLRLLKCERYHLVFIVYCMYYSIKRQGR